MTNNQRYGLQINQPKHIGLGNLYVGSQNWPVI